MNKVVEMASGCAKFMRSFMTISSRIQVIVRFERLWC
jgi:hypothetical protein